MQEGIDQIENTVEETVRSVQNLHLENLIYDIAIIAVQMVISITIIIVLSRLVRQLIIRYFDRERRYHFKAARRATLKRLSLNTLKYLTYFILIYNILSLLGIPVGTLVAGAGIIGLAISFGAKDLIADFVNGGFFILLENQFDVGDNVNFDGIVEGEVIDLGIRTTTIRSYDGTTNFIPNGDITLVSNFSKNEYRVDFQFLIFPDTDTDLLAHALEASYYRRAEGDDRVKRFQDLGVMKDEFGRLIYEVRIWVGDHNAELGVHAEYYKSFYRDISQAGIDIPMGETTTIAIDDDEDETDTKKFKGAINYED